MYVRMVIQVLKRLLGFTSFTETRAIRRVLIHKAWPPPPVQYMCMKARPSFLGASTRFSLSFVVPHPKSFLPTAHRLQWGLQVESQHNIASPTTLTDDSPRTKGPLLPVRDKVDHSNDIYVNDLKATLAAHRQTNQASIIKRYVGRNYIRPLRDPDNDEKAKVQHDSDGKHSDQISGHSENIAVNANAMGKADQSGAISTKGLPKLRKKWPVGTMQYNEVYGISKPAVPEAGAREYLESSFGPTDKWRLKQESTTIAANCPWLLKLEGTGGDSLQRLGNEIRAFERFVTPTADEMKGAREVALQVRRIVQSILRDSSCEVIGSYSTGLAMPTSDIDFSVMLAAVDRDATSHRKSLGGRGFQKLYRNALFKIQRAFGKESNFGHNAELVHARIPIVRTTHQATGLEVQIQMWSGIKRQEQYTLAYLSEYPMLRPLYFVLRSCLRMRGLGLTYEGGLGSYATLMLIVNALKHGAGQYDPLDVGSQLLHFLLFCIRIDLYQDGFSVDPPRRFVKGRKNAVAEDPVLGGIDAMAKINARYPYLLCLQDPADPTNDLGTKAYAIKHIVRTFRTVRNTIVDIMRKRNIQSFSTSKSKVMRKENIQSYSTSDSMANVPLLAPLVQANYRDFEYRRAMLSVYDPDKLDMKAQKMSGRGSKSVFRSRGTVTIHKMLQKLNKVDERKAAERACQNSPNKMEDTMSDQSKPAG
ncbi:MAG: hypothetical protein Q9212_001991 [Teloschistes hypoglaucus]